jgi:hypothetical protein
VTRFIGFLLFLLFVDDKNCAYAYHWWPPMGWVDWFQEPTFVKIRPSDLIFLGALIHAATTRKKTPLAAPMKSAALLVVATTVAWFALGLFKGGEFRFASWQTYDILSFILVAFTVAMTFRTPADYEILGKWIVAAAIYRAIMCWASYFSWGRADVGASGAFLTSHDDTITWVVSIVILLVNLAERRSLAIYARNGALILLFLGAIQFNSRRLAWVSLGIAVAAAFILYPPGRAKRAVNRMMLAALPALACYVGVGWGSQARIFLPLRSLSTVSTQEDGSTLARNAENLGLIATANWNSFIYGTGWGRPYQYLTLKYDISGFELWRYIPHNSILGLLAFTGTLGFAGFWLAFPTAMYFNARVARLAQDPRARRVAMVGAAQMLVTANQLYGDMGLHFSRPMIALGVSYAMAMRLPRVVGVWDAPAAPREPQAEPAPSAAAAS